MAFHIAQIAFGTSLTCKKGTHVLGKKYAQKKAHGARTVLPLKHCGRQSILPSHYGSSARPLTGLCVDGGRVTRSTSLQRSKWSHLFLFSYPVTTVAHPSLALGGTPAVRKDEGWSRPAQCIYLFYLLYVYFVLYLLYIYYIIYIFLLYYNIILIFIL